MRYPPLSIVWPCALDVSAYLALGRQVEVGDQACPECGRQLSRWGGYWRWLRGSDTWRLWICRGRCSSCRRSHALLPDFLLARRLDEAVLVAHEVSRARRQALVCPQFILAVSVDRGVPLG